MVETSETPEGSAQVRPEVARQLVSRLFVAAGVPARHAALVSDVLVSADMRGIRSHGLARVPYFLVRLRRGVIAARPEMSFVARTATTGLLDAMNGIGIVAADRAMREAMTMAKAHGSGFVVVKDSSHFGYAGYWAELALQAGCIGISLSNSGGRVAPTFGTDPLLGTNPLAVSIPGVAGGTDFMLDMATSTVAVGKVETALREERRIPDGWMVSRGEPRLDDDGVLSFDSALLPLGGEGTERGGHKGYGLALVVELLCGALGGTGLADRVAGSSGASPPKMGHLMGALRVDGFRPAADVGKDMEATFDLIRGSHKSPGKDRIYIHGEPESLSAARASVDGMPVTPPIMEQLERWSELLGVEPLRS